MAVDDVSPSLCADLRLEADALIAGDEIDREATIQLLVQAADELQAQASKRQDHPPPQVPGLRLFECPDCHGVQPEPGTCGRCPGTTVAVGFLRWDEGPCYICGKNVVSADGWHLEDYDSTRRHWCPSHQPIWSRA